MMNVVTMCYILMVQVKKTIEQIVSWKAKTTYISNQRE